MAENMDRRDFLKGMGSTAAEKLTTVGAVAAIEIADFIFNATEAAAEGEVNKAAQQEALALLKFAYEKDTTLKNMFSKVGSEGGTKVSEPLPIQAMTKALAMFPELAKMNIKEIKFRAAKEGDKLTLSILLKDANGKEHAVHVPGKPVQR